jgi:hypothetical protein
MGKLSRWNAEKRYQIVKEALSQKEPMGQCDPIILGVAQ